MKVALEKSFDISGPADVAWEFLQQLEAVAACMPGAKLTERLDETHFKGTVTVKMGPATMSFRGDVEVRDVDAAAHSLSLLGKGTDTTGTSGASMDLKARIEPLGDAGCRLVSTSEVSMSGKAAAFGGRMMNSVADQILKQFSERFAAQVAALAAARAAASEAAAGGAESGGTGPNDAPGPPGAASGGGAASQSVPTPIPVPSGSNELNAFALVWAVFRDWLRRLFGRKPA